MGRARRRMGVFAAVVLVAEGVLEGVGVVMITERIVVGVAGMGGWVPVLLPDAAGKKRKQLDPPWALRIAW